MRYSAVGCHLLRQCWLAGAGWAEHLRVTDAQLKVKEASGRGHATVLCVCLLHRIAVLQSVHTNPSLTLVVCYMFAAVLIELEFSPRIWFNFSGFGNANIWFVVVVMSRCVSGRQAVWWKRVQPIRRPWRMRWRNSSACTEEEISPSSPSSSSPVSPSNQHSFIQHTIQNNYWNNMKKLGSFAPEEPFHCS